MIIMMILRNIRNAVYERMSGSRVYEIMSAPEKRPVSCEIIRFGKKKKFWPQIVSRYTMHEMSTSYRADSFFLRGGS